MSSDKKRKSRDEDSTVVAEANEADAADISSQKRRRVTAGNGAGKESSKSKKKSKHGKDKKDKDKKSKKKPSKEDKEQGEVEAEVGRAVEEVVAEAEPSPATMEKNIGTVSEESKTTKKSNKDKNKKSSTATTTTGTTDTPKATTTATTNADTNTEAATGAEGDTEAPTDPKKRFIVFVGNLPYSATPDQIRSHFSAVHPTSVRLLHQRNDPTKSRGVAFVEFARFDHMKTALKLYHHSVFRAPASNVSSTNAFGARGKPTNKRGGSKNANAKGGDDVPMEERKINVELTAGGGGNTEYRKERIRAKNEKLNEQRARRAQEEARIKEKKEREKAKTAAGSDGGAAETEDSTKDIHPSRRHIHALT